MARTALALAFGLLSTSLFADTLADLKAAVGSLHGTAPCRATVDVQREENEKGKIQNAKTTGSASAEAEIDGGRLQVTYSAGLMAQVAAEDAANDADNSKPAPTVGAIRSIEAMSIAERLHYAGPLLRLLNRSKPLSETRAVWQGRPARQLVLKVTTPPPKTPVGKVEYPEDKLTVWVGEDNLPLAATYSQKVVGGILFIKGEVTASESWTFARKDDRLVVVREERTHNANGLGQHSDGREIITITLR